MTRRRFGTIAAVLIVAGALAYFLVHKPVPAPAPAEPPGPDATSTALATILDKDASYEDRMMAIRRIDRELASEEVVDVRALIRDRDVHPTIRNDSLELLERQAARPRDFGRELVAMWKDRAENRVWRDYCLQHMEKVHELDKDKALIEATLLEVSRSKGGEYSSTAMLSLERLGKRRPDLAAKVREIARKALLAKKMDKEKAVTALQIARAARDKSVLNEARKLAADAKGLVRLRMSAISMLGDLAEKRGVALLERLRSDPESRIRRVAGYNLGRLKKRYQEKGGTD